MPPPALIVALVFFLATAQVGCVNPRAARIEEHAAVFASLRTPDQEKIRQGLVDLGFRHEAVYMALGRPSRILRSPAATEDVQTWVYHNFVYGTSAAMTGPTQTGARYEGTQVTAASVRGGLTSTPRGSPTSTVDDLVDGNVVRIRLEP